MKKKIFLRCLLGAPLGLAVSVMITILISLVIGDGNYHPVVPELIADCGGELRAVLLQAGCSLLYGAAWAGASCIWEVERWSFLRQSVTHLLVTSLSTLPIAYFTRWMAHTLGGFLSYFAIFFAIYLASCLCTYFSIKQRLRRINEKVAQDRQS